MFSGHGLERLRRIGPWQQVVDLALGMAGNDTGDDVDEVGLRIDAVEFAGLHERGDDCPVLGAAIGSSKERVLAVQSDRSDGALDHVGVDLDATVVEEATEARPSRECVADGFGEFALLADKAELRLQPRFERIDDRAAFRLADVAALLGQAAADLPLDAIEFGDPRERFRDDRRGTTLREIVELPPDV